MFKPAAEAQFSGVRVNSMTGDVVPAWRGGHGGKTGCECCCPQGGRRCWGDTRHPTCSPPCARSWGAGSRPARHQAPQDCHGQCLGEAPRPGVRFGGGGDAEASGTRAEGRGRLGAAEACLVVPSCSNATPRNVPALRPALRHPTGHQQPSGDACPTCPAASLAGPERAQTQRTPG